MPSSAGTYPKVGPWPKSVINSFQERRKGSVRRQPVIWQPAETANLPTATGTAMSAPAIAGDLIYDTTANRLKVFTGSTWLTLAV